MLEHEAEKETPSVGASLKAGRERRNLGVNDICNQLHLDSRIIHALEQDDFQALPDPIYIRGYIRSYCKLVGLEPDTILEDFRQAIGRDDPEIIPEIKYPTQSSSSDKPVKAFTWLIVLGLVILLIAWWQSNFMVSNNIEITPVVVVDPALEQNNDGSTESVLEEIEANPREMNTVPVGDSPEAISIAPGDMAGAEGTDMGSIAPAEVPGLMPIQESAPQTTPSETLSADDTVTGMAGNEAESANPATTEAAEIAETEAATPEPPAQADPGTDETGAGITPSTGPDTLEIRLTADSWIEIFDANEQPVYFDLGRTGDRLTLHGTAPFDILLGFAQGVSIEFNGETVDPSPYTRAGVARFSLGE